MKFIRTALNLLKSLSVRLIIFVWLVLACCVAKAQVLRGEIFDAENKQPISGASVFLNNTTVRTVSKENGVFEVNHFPFGKYQLIVSCVGYELYTIYLQSSQIKEGLKIYLKPKVKALQEVVVEANEKDGWYKWGAFFIENFIGISAYAKDVILKNPEVVRFKYDRHNEILTAFANEPLIIENYALGYMLRYELVQFEYFFSKHLVFIKGYPLFEEMQTDKASKKERWLRNRNDVYEGSLMHFFRSLFRNRVSESGFELRVAALLSKSEVKLRQAMLRQDSVNVSLTQDSILLPNKGVSSSEVLNDSTEYYREMLLSQNKSEVLFPIVVPADSFAYAIDSATIGLFFKDKLHVTYVRKKAPIEITEALNGKEVISLPLSYPYINILSSQSRRPSEGLISKLELIGGKEITIWANGAFYESTDILAFGYWAFWERIATLLPLDFKTVVLKKGP